MGLLWTNLLSVGNQAIDIQHESLFQMVNQIEAAIDKRDTSLLIQTFESFKEAALEHFSYEARIAAAIGYPFEKHTLEHEYVIKELHTMRDELVSIDGRWSESAVEYYYQFLSNWAVMHITDDDMQMKAAFETYPYDFNPPLPD